ncbi:hypothetical protein AGDE_04996 [Angomonas deanei]|uniref:PH domain-containing protein n=1 Tax=Angomonas deanei TaxID=59799 RepID=S9VDN1_9TRYP|nr:hypothetical protein AGDE_12069 [Angomonas deanei]EPY38933.1 hypothetical protein AGDE_04996 [Angomonas deanei]CAD2218703.1 hypothetical protein, conserved [Angomonas deanei]|eukprot:EPY25003.1 hypothetical protein AGDE_12069 [Angomonas deanei]
MDGPTTETQEGIRLTRLSARAVVRLDDVSSTSFDHNDLPVDGNKSKSSKKPNIGKMLKGMASYLSSRISLAYQESEVTMKESVGGLLFEVKAVASSRILFQAPLHTLVDISSDSVIKRENITFSELPDTFDPEEKGNNSFVEPHETETALKKGELITTLFRAYGEIGLSLVFKASRVETDKAEPFTKVEMRFLSSTDRDTWQSFCTEAYVGLLLDSIRNPNVTYSDQDKSTVPPQPLSPETVESYIDFFLSGKGGETGAKSGTVQHLNVVPHGGRLLVKGHMRKLSVETHSSKEEAGRAQSYLAIHRSSIKQRRGKFPTLRIPLEEIQISAEDESIGTTFYIVHSPPVKPSCTAEETVKLCHFEEMHGSILCEAASYDERAIWFKWFNTLLGREVTFLKQKQKTERIE